MGRKLHWLVKRQPLRHVELEAAVRVHVAVEHQGLRLISVVRPEPPGHLTERHAKIWRQVAATKPADWFRADTFPLLAAYCHHVAAAMEIDRKIEANRASADTDDMEQLFKMRERESRAIVALARSMRLTQQSQLKAETAYSRQKNEPASSPPWEWGG